jgi:hypothetical protein
LNQNAFPFEMFPRCLVHYVLLWLIDFSDGSVEAVVAKFFLLFGIAKRDEENEGNGLAVGEYDDDKYDGYVLDLRSHRVYSAGDECEGISGDDLSRGLGFARALEFRSFFKRYGYGVLFGCIDFGSVRDIFELKERMRAFDDACSKSNIACEPVLSYSGYGMKADCVCLRDSFGGVFPDKLRYLQFGNCYNQSLVGVALPSSLTTLKFGDDYNQSLVGVAFPSSLTTLIFGDDFNQSLVGIYLPSSLTTLEFGLFNNESLIGVYLPSSLTTLILVIVTIKVW